MKAFLQLITATMLVFFMSACGGSSSGGGTTNGGTTSGDTVQTGTVTSNIDGVTENWYTVKIDNEAGIVNSASISELENGDITLLVQSYENKEMSGENSLQFFLTFPGGSITTGEVTGSLFMYAGDASSEGLVSYTFTANLTTATGDAKSAHLAGNFMLQAIEVESDITKNVSVTFDVQADKIEIDGL
jgi:hypothetical protein